LLEHLHAEWKDGNSCKDYDAARHGHSWVLLGQKNAKSNMLSALAPEKKNLVNQPLLIHADRESPAIESFKSCSKYSTSP